ncbi:hypothetical protein ASE38_03930 [Cellulomonas sp. Root930]|nr:hypothetical protein ASE38_03930 [Cellulomonas sp. Root930]
MAAVEQVYRYVRPSSVGVLDGLPDLRLATSGGELDPNPHFFEGTLGHAEQMAVALLMVARVARTRFYVPPGMLAAVLRAADPVVTSNGDRLRFESFSACCGVHVRLDVLPGALGGPALATGTTNVDVNPPMRQALAGIGGDDALHLSVGEDLTVTTAAFSVTEEKVPLPERWLKGFAEVQVAGSTMVPVLEMGAVEARRFVQSLPRTGSALLWATSTGGGLRLAGRASPSSVPVAGAHRLRVLEPLLRFATGLRAYAPAVVGAAPAIWELSLQDARVSVTLSPEVGRGFSGEGGVLRDLADAHSAADADLVSALLAFEPRIDVLALASDAGLPAERVLRALGRLGAAGRVGYDAHDAGYFHRELPYDPAVLLGMHPRLADARALVEAGAVQADGDVARVRSGDIEYVVRTTATGTRCTCPWYGRHQDTRGPCKHVLAVELAARG